MATGHHIDSLRKGEIGNAVTSEAACDGDDFLLCPWVPRSHGPWTVDDPSRLPTSRVSTASAAADGCI